MKTDASPAGQHPTTIARLAAIAASAALLAWRGRDRRATAVARVAGAACLGAASWPLVEDSLYLNGERKRRLAVRSSVEIARPIADVFEFFKDFENLPQVIRAVSAVYDSRDGRSHWVVRSGSGVAMEWDAVVTKWVPRSVIAFASVPDSPVEVSITLRFVPLGPSLTRLDADVNYHVLHTELSDAIRALLTRRPARRMRLNLETTRAYLESLPAQAASGALPYRHIAD
ncbi:MAG TPA: SRPBCC family protein [Gemmatimonadaceae bacterium]|nr:SRPBCC family protein [Gemmatimonadaceae bacterium]